MQTFACTFTLSAIVLLAAVNHPGANQLRIAKVLKIFAYDNLFPTFCAKLLRFIP